MTKERYGELIAKLDGFRTVAELDAFVEREVEPIPSDDPLVISFRDSAAMYRDMLRGLEGKGVGR